MTCRVDKSGGKVRVKLRYEARLTSMSPALDSLMAATMAGTSLVSSASRLKFSIVSIATWPRGSGVVGGEGWGEGRSKGDVRGKRREASVAHPALICLGLRLQELVTRQVEVPEVIFHLGQTGFSHNIYKYYRNILNNKMFHKYFL